MWPDCVGVRQLLREHHVGAAPKHSLFSRVPSGRAVVPAHLPPQATGPHRRAACSTGR